MKHKITICTLLSETNLAFADDIAYSFPLLTTHILRLGIVLLLNSISEGLPTSSSLINRDELIEQNHT